MPVKAKALLLTSLFWTLCSLPVFAYKSAAIAVYDVDTGSYLYRNNSLVKRAPASTIKVLTALTAWKISDPDKWVRISKHATSAQPTKAYLQEGEEYRLRDLIKLSLVASCNDAARAVGEGASGSEWRFAQDMEKMAKSVGATSTVVTNASGLPSPSGMVTTCVDNIKIVMALKEVPELHEMMKSSYASIVSKTGRKVTHNNHNRLMREKFTYPVYGKTGFTNAARHCFLSYCDYNGRSLVICVLGAPSSAVLWDDLRKLYRTYMTQDPTGVPSYMKSNNISLEKLHSALASAGFPLEKKESVYGAYTKKAVMAFQKARKLQVDGLVGPQTWGSLKR